jgi:hypothetical protein
MRAIAASASAANTATMVIRTECVATKTLPTPARAPLTKVRIDSVLGRRGGDGLAGGSGTATVLSPMGVGPFILAAPWWEPLHSSSPRSPRHVRPDPKKGLHLPTLTLSCLTRLLRAEGHMRSGGRGRAAQRLHVTRFQAQVLPVRPCPACPVFRELPGMRSATACAADGWG